MPDIITPAITPPAPAPRATKVRARQIVIDLPAGAMPTVRVATEAISIEDGTGSVLGHDKPPAWLPAEFAIDPAMHPSVVKAVQEAVIQELIQLRPAWYAKETAVLDEEAAQYQTLLDEDVAAADAAQGEADNLRAAAAARQDQIAAMLTTLSTLDPEVDADQVVEVQTEIANHQQAIAGLESLAGQQDGVALTNRRNAESWATSLSIIAKSRADLDTAFANDPFEIR